MKGYNKCKKQLYSAKFKIRKDTLGCEAEDKHSG